MSSELTREQLRHSGGLDQLDDHITANHWLTAHAAAHRLDDAHATSPTDHELTDVVRAWDADLGTAFPEATDDSVVAPVDSRETSQPLPRPSTPEEDWTRVPTPDETAHAVDRAKEALAELHRRRHHDQRREDEDVHADQVARWRAERDTVQAAEDEPVLSGPLG